MISALIVDDESTWPNELIDHFEGELDSLRAFQPEERRILDLKYQKEWQNRWPPVNPFQGVWDAVIARATELASGLLFAGYHCTRLTLEEREAILRSGMVPLSAEHFELRVRARIAAGDLPPEIGSTLLARNYVNDQDSGERLNRTCFSLSNRGHGGRCIDGEDGIDHFFRFWGRRIALPPAHVRRGNRRRAAFRRGTLYRRSGSRDGASL